jgi:hypothetical protein
LNKTLKLWNSFLNEKELSLSKASSKLQSVNVSKSSGSSFKPSNISNQAFLELLDQKSSDESFKASIIYEVKLS